MPSNITQTKLKNTNTKTQTHKHKHTNTQTQLENSQTIMASPIYSVTCFTRALVSPGYTPQTDERWLDCVWGHYTSQKCAELAIFRQILDDPDHGNYKVLYEEDIPRLDEEGESDHAWGRLRP